MSSFNNLKMIAGTAKTSHILLLVTSVILIGVGVYGAVVSKEYGCDSGLFINLKNKKVLDDLLPPSCMLMNPMNPNTSQCEDDIMSSKLVKCITDAMTATKKKFNLNTLDSCLDEKAKGHVKCMEGGLMTFSTISIIVGVLMLLLSGYLLFM